MPLTRHAAKESGFESAFQLGNQSFEYLNFILTDLVQIFQYCKLPAFYVILEIQLNYIIPATIFLQLDLKPNSGILL